MSDKIEKPSLANEIAYLESLESTDIPQDIIQSFEDYLELLEKSGEYEGNKPILFIFGIYSIVCVFIFSQMGAGPGWKIDISRLFSLLPTPFQCLLQGTIFSAIGWIIAQRNMKPIEKKMFNLQWLQKVSIVTFLTGISFWLFGSVSFANVLPWIAGAYLGAHLVTKDSSI